MKSALVYLCVCLLTKHGNRRQYLFEMEVSKISKHFSFHFFGLPGNWERGILFSFNISSISVSALSIVRGGGGECEGVGGTRGGRDIGYTPLFSLNNSESCDHLLRLIGDQLCGLVHYQP